MQFPMSYVGGPVPADAINEPTVAMHADKVLYKHLAISFSFRRTGRYESLVLDLGVHPTLMNTTYIARTLIHSHASQD